MSQFPTEDMALTTILVVSDLQKAKAFYEDILGARLYREYGGTSVVFSFLGCWLLIVTGDGPTEDKPDVHFKPPKSTNEVSHSFTIRVRDCRGVYHILKQRGAVFLTPPLEYESEIRCFFCDPDGHLFEISESK